MTCIVGIEHDGKVLMGGDAASVSGWQGQQSALAKVFFRGPFLIGYTDSFRMGQLLQHHLEVPAQTDGVDDEAYMVTAFIPAVRECLKEGGYARKKDEEESAGQFLVGYNGKLYLVDSDYQVNRFLDGYNAVGSGAAYALGSLYATTTVGMEPRERAIEALLAAERFSIGVASPFTILEEPACE